MNGWFEEAARRLTRYPSPLHTGTFGTHSTSWTMVVAGKTFYEKLRKSGQTAAENRSFKTCEHLYFADRFPELYFANLVIFGEGPSEEIVLKKVFEVQETPLDAHFISIVPLGGRHVNHFWRLLNGLGIPYLTLLDLDHEKEGAGWGRIQYVRDQLVSLHGADSPKLAYTAEGGVATTLSSDVNKTLHANLQTDKAQLSAWLSFFRDKYDVFFSNPLDLDLSLLEAFPDVYKGLIVAPQRGPQLPEAEDVAEYDKAIDARVKQVLAADASKAPADLGQTYTEAQKELFPYYKYFFVDGSKPVTHMRALIQLAPEKLKSDMPQTLKDLVARAKSLSKPKTEEPAVATS